MFLQAIITAMRATKLYHKWYINSEVEDLKLIHLEILRDNHGAPLAPEKELWLK